MRDTLFIHLRDSGDAPLPFALTGAEPGLGVRTEHAPLEQILGQAAGRRVVLIVPATDIRVTSVQVPARQARKVLQAAPYLLEDQFAEDVDTLHFAIGARQPDGAYPVAAVARTRMEAWLARFRARGVRPEAVVPESLCLPAEPRHWTALADSDRIVVRTGVAGAFACTPDALATCLSLADPENKMPLRLYLTRGVERDFTALGRPVELLPGYGSALEILARHVLPDTSINLLQGDWSQKEDWQRLARPWRAAAALAGAWIVLALANEAVHAWRLGYELESLEQRNVERYQALFPSEQKIVDLAAQAEQQLAALRGGGGRAPLLPLLEVLAASLAETPGLTLRSLQFRDSALYLSLTGNDLQALETLQGWYAARTDARLEVQAANAGSEGVQIRLKLSLA